jgi:hypothetical protein
MGRPAACVAADSVVAHVVSWVAVAVVSPVLNEPQNRRGSLWSSIALDER